VQFVPSLRAGDAVSNLAVELHDLMSPLVDCEIRVSDVGGDAPRPVAPVRRYAPRPGDVVVYHHAAGLPIAERFLDLQGVTRVLAYHNVTPPQWFAGYDNATAAVCAVGVDQFRRAAPVCDLVVTPSRWNAAEARDAGAQRVEVAPLIVSRDYLDTPADPDTLASLAARPGPRLLFVGRMAPNKRQDLLVHAFALLRRGWHPSATLHLVGAPTVPQFVAQIDEAIATTGTTGVERPGPVPLAALLAHYRGADLFVSASEHEGFCAPVLEAVHFGLPVVARPGGAVAETLGGAGLVVDSGDPAVLAAAWALVLEDAALRRGFAAARADVLARLGPDVARQRWAEILTAVLDGT
jgi:glycosyltransferase involved in cell wall biosynthesis